ncbi:hypothetical protein PENANT_c009G06706 [Penicillium antarcticum]|uniref:Uncharacterized protein n=2 Tax=Penicillium antarcticum TaxID=416450 RepID=A0A1V6Q927_9EURO|nr:hypothetical protein PENANT_c009G06706 [Penicillium antarcticum]
MPTKRVRAQKKKKQPESPPESSGDERESDSNSPAKKVKTVPKVKNTKCTKATILKKKENNRKVPSVNRPRRRSIKKYRSGPRSKTNFYPQKSDSYEPRVENLDTQQPPVLKSEEAWDDNVPLPVPRDLVGKLGDTVVPDIYVGDMAPMPRWRIVRQRSPHKSYSPGTGTSSNRSSADSTSNSSPSFELYRWTWAFDAGESWSWRGLEYDQLYLYAHQCLTQILKDPFQRERIRHSVSGPMKEWPPVEPDQLLPALLLRPRIGYFDLDDKKSILKEPPTETDSSYCFPDYERPTLAIRSDPNGIEDANMHQTLTNSR